MPNMSYCRFQNTLSDLRDCEEALRDGALDGGVDGEGDLSAEERYAALRLVELCGEITADYGMED